MHAWSIGAPSSGTTDDPEMLISVFIIQARCPVTVDHPISALWERSSPPNEAVLAAVDAFDAARVAIEAEVEAVLGRLRALKQQAWLGLSVDRPRMVGYGLYDPTTGDRLPVGLTQHGTSTMPSKQSAVSRADLENAVAEVTAGAEPPLAETILADARYLAWHQEPAHPSQAILMAAIACEIKAKADIRARCKPEQNQLIRYLLDERRATGARPLFHEIPRRSQGRSLLESNKQLYDRIHRLFERRNEIAHSGVVPSADEAGDLVRGARDAFRWLDDAPGSHM